MADGTRMTGDETRDLDDRIGRQMDRLQAAITVLDEQLRQRREDAA